MLPTSNQWRGSDRSRDGTLFLIRKCVSPFPLPSFDQLTNFFLLEFLPWSSLCTLNP